MYAIVQQTKVYMNPQTVTDFTEPFYTLFKGEATAVLSTAENKTTHFDTLLMPHHQCICGIPFGKTKRIPKTHNYRNRITNLAKNSTNQTTQNHHTTA